MKALGLLILALLLPAPLFAADARALYEKGSQALAAGKADEAVSAFEASYASYPSPTTLFWLAEAERALGHNRKAVKYYRDYLKKAPGGPKVADASARLAELRKAPPVGKRRRREMSLAELDLRETAKRVKSPPAPVVALPAPVVVAPPAAVVAPPATVVVAVAKPAPVVAAPVVAAAVVVATPAVIERSAVPVRPGPAVDTALSRSGFRADTDTLTYVQYTARLVGTNGSFMMNYATTANPGPGGTLYTHGLGVGAQTEHFKNGVYLGFGTEFGGAFGAGTDTLLRYELSWQCLWNPLGSEAWLTPQIGFRLGGMGVKSERLTGGSLKPGVVVAVLSGLNLQISRWVSLSGGIGYDANLGPDLGPTASVSGYSVDFGGALRF